MDDQEPLPLEYESPRQRMRPPRDYRGCLLPIAITVAVIGIYYNLLERPDTPRDQNTAEFRLLAFFGIAIVLAIFGRIKTNKPK